MWYEQQRERLDLRLLQEFQPALLANSSIRRGSLSSSRSRLLIAALTITCPDSYF
jgi:hypothetical protein